MEPLDLGVCVAAFILEVVVSLRLTLLALTHGRIVWEPLRKFALEIGRCFSCKCQQLRKEKAFVLEKVDHLRMRVARIYLHSLLALSLGALAVAQRNYLTGTEAIGTQNTRWLVAVYGIVAALHFSVPKVMSPTAVTIMYIVLMLASILATYMDATYTVASWIVVAFFCRVPAVVLTRRFSFVAFFSVPFLLIEARRSPVSVLALEALLMLMTAILALSKEVLLKQAAEYDIRYNEARTELEVAKALLRLICDAVIELDSSLRLNHHSKELAIVLLKDRPGFSLAGDRFADFVATREEAARAVELLVRSRSTSQSSRNEIAAGAFHTRLVDSCGSKFRTEVFHVRYRKPDGRPGYLLGLRDFTDQKSLAAASAADAEPEVPLPSEPREPEQSPVFLSYQLDESSQSNSHCPATKSDLSLAAVTEPKLQHATEQAEGFCLQLNMKDVVVEAASPGVSPSLGMGLDALFPGAGRKLLQEVWAKQAQRLREPVNSRQVVGFQKLLTSWSALESEELDGTLEALLCADGSAKLLMRCHKSHAVAGQPAEMGFLSVLPGGLI